MENFTYASLDPLAVTPAGTRHLNCNRTFQGIPSIGISPKGRLFACWYGGGTDENRDNFIMLKISDDRGESWSKEPVAVVDAGAESVVRVFDASLFTSREGKVYWFWSQGCGGPSGQCVPYDGIAGVWFSELLNPDDDPQAFRFSPARRIANGVIMNPPITLADGTWALPVSVWTGNYERHRSLAVRQGCFFYVSTDDGASFECRGRIDMSEVEGGASFDEHRFVERKDGSIQCYIRVNRGVAEAVSRDGGRSWSLPVLSTKMDGPCSRICVARLKSGNLLFVNNDVTYHRTRERMTAYLSTDDGASWPYKLLLDERAGVAYPDFVQDADGTIATIYDFARYTGGDILFARFTEADVLAGKLVSSDSHFGISVDHTHTVPGREAQEKKA
ncbi:MAG: sialidase family protein [Victivallaceae bacterium]|nr:sialidase family protein [Victivallaceae bacterium]